MLARACQDATWRRAKATLELRSLLREYYPGYLDGFAGKATTNLATSEAREVLALAPTPAAGAKLSTSRIAAALRRPADSVASTLGPPRSRLRCVVRSYATSNWWSR